MLWGRGAYLGGWVEVARVERREEEGEEKMVRTKGLVGAFNDLHDYIKEKCDEEAWRLCKDLGREISKLPTDNVLLTVEQGEALRKVLDWLLTDYYVEDDKGDVCSECYVLLAKDNEPHLNICPIPEAKQLMEQLYDDLTRTK